MSVASALDNGSGCTLRNALLSVNAQANTGGCTASGAYGSSDRINVSATGTLTLNAASGTLLVNRAVQIVGPGASALTIACPSGSAFSGVTIVPINNGVNVQAQGLTISHCTAAPITDSTFYLGQASGSAVTVCAANAAINVALTDVVLSGNQGGPAFEVLEGDRGTVSFTDSTISGNAAPNCAAVYSAYSNLTIDRTTISGNQTSGSVGGMCLDNLSVLTMTNSTISGNQGVRINSAGSLVSVTNSTIAYQTGAGGTGIDLTPGPQDLSGQPLSSSVALRNTIVAGNASVDIALAASNALSPGGWQANYSIVQNLGGETLTGTGNLSGAAVPTVATWLGPLAANGGLTQTHALLGTAPANPAIDQGDPSAAGLPATDQRGAGHPRVDHGRVDIGAFESTFAAPVVPGAATPVPGLGGAGLAALSALLAGFGLRRRSKR